MTRPHTERVRMSDIERADLDELARLLGATHSEAIRVAVRGELGRRAPPPVAPEPR